MDKLPVAGSTWLYNLSNNNLPVEQVNWVG